MIDLSPFKNLVPSAAMEELELHGRGSVLTTYRRALHFLSQLDYESGGFKRVEENLNYSARRLAAVFG